MIKGIPILITQKTNIKIKKIIIDSMIKGILYITYIYIKKENII